MHYDNKITQLDIVAIVVWYVIHGSYIRQFLKSIVIPTFKGQDGILFPMSGYWVYISKFTPHDQYNYLRSV